MNTLPNEEKVWLIERPDRSLLTYYLLLSLLSGPLFPLVFLPYWFRYSTLRYRFTRDGISMSWGILFRRQVIVNYARIQDSHLRSNVVERWLGLGRVLIQTASGNAEAEMTIEGIKDFELVRDFLYHRLRGVNDDSGKGGEAVSDPAAQEALLLAEEMRKLRTVLAAKGGRHGL